MNNYTSISKVKAETVKRVSTGHDELDWLYGLSKADNLYQWGIPVRTISTWVGEGGVGKSRLAINLAKFKVKSGKSVLYLQNEVDLTTLAGWVNDDSLDNFYCSDETSLVQQTNIIRHLRPDFVFVDSINLIDEFGSGTAKSIKTIIDAFREAIEGSETHIVILCQLNKEGSATGSTALSHLPDINLSLTNTKEDGIFAVSIGKKHRYGRKGATYTSLWRHIETGVECISKNRYADDRWIVPDSYGAVKLADFGERRQRKMTMAEHVATATIPDRDGGDIGSVVPDIDLSIIPDRIDAPQLVKGDVTIDNVSPAVREAYYELNPDQKPENGIIKFVKKRWGIG
jgi:archaellum biogenesis ATPase FlaH